ncbi:hypothetical protein C8R43DRAFT_1037753 [Mycena crocata]|nr:hypothetical protein C8R43DRAFT_1037753 [Mycena crocata]
MPPTQKPKKLPACDLCKLRRVLCHPQPDGAPCPRCLEKNDTCTTTPVPRGRPRKIRLPASSSSDSSAANEASFLQLEPQISPSPSALSTVSLPIDACFPDCPELTPELVEHLFKCFSQFSQVMNPIIMATSIRTTVSTVSFRLNLLSPQSRVLALCVVAIASLISFHEAVLGSGPRPESFSDAQFFSCKAQVRACGRRRTAVCRALHATALRAAWDIGVMLQVSNENAASCLLLDLLEQSDFSGASRPWASAYLSHVRALAPMWRTSTASPPLAGHWAGALFAEAFLATRNRKPILFTLDDQLLLTGPEPPPPDTLLASLEASAETPGVGVLLEAIRPYTLNVSCLARQLWETISGDHARLSPLSESAVMNFLSSLSLIYAILSRLLDRADSIVTPTPKYAASFPLSGEHQDAIARSCAFAITMGYTMLAYALHRELEYRHMTADGATADRHTQTRMELLRTQAREMARLGVPALARAIRRRYLPAVHYAPLQWHTVRDYAQFALHEIEAGAGTGTLCNNNSERLRDLATISEQLGMVGYSLDLLSSPPAAALIARLDAYIDGATGAAPYFDSNNILEDMFLTLDNAWMEPCREGGMLIGL